MAPLEVFPSTARTIAHITPHAWANDAFSKLLKHGGDLITVLPQIAVLLAFALAAISLARVAAAPHARRVIGRRASGRARASSLRPRPARLACDPEMADLATAVDTGDAPGAPGGVPARKGEDDPLIAPAAAVPSRSGRDPSLLDCARVFARQPSPPYLLGAVVLVLAARAVQGAFSWRDLVMIAGLVAVTPFVEWTIHVYLLHARPFTLFGRKVESPQRARAPRPP